MSNSAIRSSQQIKLGVIADVGLERAPVRHVTHLIVPLLKWIVQLISSLWRHGRLYLLGITLFQSQM